MNDISYINIARQSDASILRHIGKYIKHHRLQQNRSQADVAHDASVSRSTLSLLERGEGTNLSSLIQVMRVLELLYVFQQFEVNHQISPLVLAKEDRAKRQRARSKKETDSKPDSEW